jgi:adenosine deaminase
VPAVQPQAQGRAVDGRASVEEADGRGLCVTVNSDDPSFFGGYVNDNYIACQAALGLSRQDLVALARNSFIAAFMPAAQRDAALAAIDAYDRDAAPWVDAPALAA